MALDTRSVLQAVIQHGEDSGMRLIVHLPTVTGCAHKSRLAHTPAHPLLAGDSLCALTVTGEDGALRSEVRELLRMARDLPIVISTGHADGREVRLLVEEAVRLDTPRLILNQPANPLTGLTCADLLDIASAQQVYTEQTALTHLLGYQHWDDFSGVLARVPRVVYSSDPGQTSQMDIGEWRASSESWFAKAGMDEARIAEVTRDAPLRMLGL